MARDALRLAQGGGWDDTIRGQEDYDPTRRHPAAVPDENGTRAQRRQWARQHPNARERTALPCLGGFTMAHRERRCDCHTDRVRT
jgi:hypothetical protein